MNPRVRDDMPRHSEEPAVSPRQKAHEVFQPKQGRYAELPPAKISEMLKSNTLDNAPTQSLLSVVNGILDESIDKKSGEIPDRVACLLRKVVSEIERRISTQAEHIRNQNNHFKTREEKYQSRIRVLETLATGTSIGSQTVVSQLQIIKAEKPKVQERKKLEDSELASLIKEKEDNDLMVAKLKTELEIKNKLQEEHLLRLEAKFKESKDELIREKENSDSMLAILKAELEEKDKSLEQHPQVQFKTKIKEATEALAKEKEESDMMVAKLREEMELIIKSHNRYLLQVEAEDREAKEVLLKDKESSDNMVAKLKEEIQLKDRLHEEQCTKLESKAKEAKGELANEKLHFDITIAKLKEEIELKSKSFEEQYTNLNTKLKETKEELEEKKKQMEEIKIGTDSLLAESRKNMKQLEESLESNSRNWKMKENIYQSFVGVQLNLLKNLRLSSDSIKKEVADIQKEYVKDFNKLGMVSRSLGAAAENYHMVLAENRKLHNEVQELKGNIRVYCRIRPFLSGENEKSTTIEFIGEDGELLVANPSKQGKDGHRMFNFDKVFGPNASQEDVYLDTQPLIRSALDGFNVCIFAYGQTGSGKTYTMTGPVSSSKENWGINYRALNDLFHISQSRKSSFTYDVEVQMIEVYNEQVRDLLSNDASQKRLGIRSAAQPNGLAVPNASVYPVQSTSDVLELMQIGQSNRAMSATALNERSSRSHSVLTIHIRATDVKSGSSLRGSLHLVDLAGSERIDRSEVTGDRLREAQHINKSLSALGDVISALAQKTSHVPYRNSKLTQLLQTSLGGHAKTLMFVQVNPDAESYLETLSTLKFAERVSGVELGAARSSKEGKDVRELLEQVASLKDVITRKDEEIEQLVVLKEHTSNSLGHSSSSPSLHSLSGADQRDQDLTRQTASMGNARNREQLESLVGDTSELEMSSGGEYDKRFSSTSSGDDSAEVDRTAEVPKPRLPSQGPRSPTPKVRSTMTAQAKLKEPLKISLNPRRNVTGQASTPPKGGRQWK